MKKEYHVLGGMAGSSMDGLDLASVTFWKESEKWHFKLKQCRTIKYPSYFYQRLKEPSHLSIDEKKKLDKEFGTWIADQVILFPGNETLELLAIHGHTVVHSPEKGISWQLGAGEEIASRSKFTTITDFRSKDVMLGGQGAPLVPFGDFELFAEYDACLNLGGIANISIKRNKVAGDICPCNQVLNHYANQMGHDFDEAGKLARAGKVDDSFLNELRQIPFFQLPFPKSLPNQFISNEILNTISPNNGLRSYAEFISEKLAESIAHLEIQDPKMLVTGGGAFNAFLMELISDKLEKWKVIVPSSDIVCFKEAIIFGFLGLMKFMDKPNVLSSVTGANHDTSSGVIHLPK